MKHTIGCSAIWTVMILFILVLVPCTAFAYNMPDFDTINEQLEADVKAFHIPGMAVIVVNKDEVLFAEAYGNCESIETTTYSIQEAVFAVKEKISSGAALLS